MVVHVTRGRFQLSIFADIKSRRYNLHESTQQPFKTITQRSSPSHINKSLKRNLFLNFPLEMKMSSVPTKVLKSITRYRSRLNVKQKCLICPSWRAAKSSRWGGSDELPKTCSFMKFETFLSRLQIACFFILMFY